MNNNGKKKLDMRVLGETGYLLTSQATLISSIISQTHWIDRRWSNLVRNCKSFRACFIFWSS